MMAGVKRVETGDPERVVFRAAGRWWRRLTARALISFALVLCWVRFLADDLWKIAGVLVFLGCVAAILVFEGGIEFNPTRRTWRTWWGFLFPWSSRTGSLTPYETVHLEVGATQNGTPHHQLRWEGDRVPSVMLGTATRVADARRMACEAAEALGFRLVDGSGDPPFVREVGRAGEGLRDAASVPARDKGDMGSAPAAWRSLVEPLESSVRIRLPPCGFRDPWAGMLLAGAGGSRHPRPHRRPRVPFRRPSPSRGKGVARGAPAEGADVLSAGRGPLSPAAPAGRRSPAPPARRW